MSDSREYPIGTLREILRTAAVAKAARLSRSVARLTSCDALSCDEYGQEVGLQHAIARELLGIQHCRAALERCIASGHAATSRRLPDGTVVRAGFRKTSPGRVRAWGLEAFTGA